MHVRVCVRVCVGMMCPLPGNGVACGQVMVYAKTICDCSGDCPRCQPFITDASRTPSGTNPNYLLRIVLVSDGTRSLLV